MVDTQTQLRDYTAAALSATTSETGIALNSTNFEAFKVALSIAAFTGYSVGTVDWAITVQVSTALASGYVTVATVAPTLGLASETEVVLGGDQINDFVASATYIRCTATKSGAAGNLSYGAWLVPLEGGQ
jgi:hypothetical protein